jgi:type II secretion system protein N
MGGASVAGHTLPRALVAAAYPLAGIVLTLFFIFLGFPYDLLAARISSAVEESTSLNLRIGRVSPHLGLRGLGLAIRDVRTGRQEGPQITIQKLVLRPAWSSSWFSGIPALHISAESEIGNGDGTLFMGEAVGWQGRLEGVQLAPLLQDTLQEGFELSGALDADIDLHANATEQATEGTAEGREDAERSGLVGHVRFDLRDGSFSGPGLPISVPFERLTGDLHFGDGSFVRVEGARLEGPVLAATVAGNIGAASRRGAQPLDLRLSYELRDKSLARTFGSTRGEGVISGTLQKPVFE